MSAVGHDQGVLRSATIARIALAQLNRKAQQVSIRSALLRLFISAPRAFFGTCIEIDLDLRLGKDPRAHVAAVGDRSGGHGSGALPAEQGGAHLRVGGDARVGAADGLGTDMLLYLIAVEQHATGNEADPQLPRQLAEGRSVVGIDVGAQGGQRERAIECAAVAEMKPQTLSQRGGDRCPCRCPMGRRW